MHFLDQSRIPTPEYPERGRTGGMTTVRLRSSGVWVPSRPPLPTAPAPAPARQVDRLVLTSIGSDVALLAAAVLARTRWLTSQRRRQSSPAARQQPLQPPPPRDVGSDARTAAAVATTATTAAVRALSLASARALLLPCALTLLAALALRLLWPARQPVQFPTVLCPWVGYCQ